MLHLVTIHFHLALIKFNQKQSTFNDGVRATVKESVWMGTYLNYPRPYTCTRMNGDIEQYCN